MFCFQALCEPLTTLRWSCKKQDKYSFIYVITRNGTYFTIFTETKIRCDKKMYESIPWSLLPHFRQLWFQMSLVLLETGNILLQNLHLARQLRKLSGQSLLLLFNPVQFFRSFSKLVKILSKFSTLALQQLQLLNLDGQLLLRVLTQEWKTFISITSLNCALCKTWRKY